ncbi:MAG: hypothetical protein SFV23_15200 [Planctomycetaceae bacterium]|nr:hypothetical protein [Planctomycetaceae bacterium]
MTGWFLQNWGNVASVLGLALSVWAAWVAKNASLAVAGFRKGQANAFLLAKLELALTGARALCNDNASRLSQRKCDELREHLITITNSRLLAGPEQQELKASTTWFHKPLLNDSNTKTQMRKLVDTLIRVRDSAQSQLEDGLAS